jgi:hypothetical protein
LNFVIEESMTRYLAGDAFVSPQRDLSHTSILYYYYNIYGVGIYKYERRTAGDSTTVIEEAKAYSGVVESRTSLRLRCSLGVCWFTIRSQNITVKYLI